MHQLDRMLSTAPTTATLSNVSASRPTAALGGMAASGSFSSTFAQVQHDINRYIANGAGSAASSVATASTTSPSVNPVANWQAMLMRQTGAGAIDGHTTGTGASALQQQFLASIQPWAEETGARLGVSADVVAAHAALESGWGRHPLRQAGADSNNLFGLKAGAGWQGAVASATTTEFEHGAMLKKVEQFRSYPDTATAFRDYADLLSTNPRYQAALNTGNDARAFAQGLVQGGYATDPQYADKLTKLAAQLQRGAALTAPEH